MKISEVAFYNNDDFTQVYSDFKAGDISDHITTSGEIKTILTLDDLIFSGDKIQVIKGHTVIFNEDKKYLSIFKVH
jgi:hypothetical protein